MSQRRRTYSEKTKKALFAMSGNRCAFPDCTVRIVEDSAQGAAYIAAEICHILPFGKAGPRAGSASDGKAHDDLDNLILLCPTHHARVDGRPDDYPVHVLRAWNQRVRQPLTRPIERPAAREAKGVAAAASAEAAQKSGDLGGCFRIGDRALRQLTSTDAPSDEMRLLVAQLFAATLRSAAFLPDPAAKVSTLLLDQGSEGARRGLFADEDIPWLVLELASVNQGFRNYVLVDELLAGVTISGPSDPLSAKLVPRQIIQALARKRTITPAEAAAMLRDASQDDKSAERNLLVQAWTCLGSGNLSQARNFAEQALATLVVDPMLRREAWLTLQVVLLASGAVGPVEGFQAVGPFDPRRAGKLRPSMEHILGGFGAIDRLAVQALLSAHPDTIVETPGGSELIARATRHFMRLLVR